MKGKPRREKIGSLFSHIFLKPSMNAIRALFSDFQKRAKEVSSPTSFLLEFE